MPSRRLSEGESPLNERAAKHRSREILHPSIRRLLRPNSTWWLICPPPTRPSSLLCYLLSPLSVSTRSHLPADCPSLSPPHGIQSPLLTHTSPIHYQTFHCNWVSNEQTDSLFKKILPEPWTTSTRSSYVCSLRSTFPYKSFRPVFILKIFVQEWNRKWSRDWVARSVEDETQKQLQQIRSLKPLCGNDVMNWNTENKMEPALRVTTEETWDVMEGGEPDGGSPHHLLSPSLVWVGEGSLRVKHWRSFPWET